MPNQAYVISANPGAETRHPVYSDRELLPQGEMVLYTPTVARRYLDKTILMVTINKETGAPMFDMSNDAHLAACEIYSQNDASRRVDVVKFGIQETETQIKQLYDQAEEISKTLVHLDGVLDSQREELERLESETEETDADLQAAFSLAVEKLEKGNDEHWTNDKAPDVRAINQVLEDMHKAEEVDELHKLTAAERDTLWAQHEKGE